MSRRTGLAAALLILAAALAPGARGAAQTRTTPGGFATGRARKELAFSFERKPTRFHTASGTRCSPGGGQGGRSSRRSAPTQLR